MLKNNFSVDFFFLENDEANNFSAQHLPIFIGSKNTKINS